VQQIAAGWGQTCALVKSGDVYCWGVAVVNSSKRDSATPVRVRGTGKVKAISAVLTNTCAIDATDHAWCWGTDWQETFKRHSSVRTRIPNLIEELPALTQIAVGYAHICVILKSDGSVWCWGGNGAGELGDGTTVERAKPVRAGQITGATWIAASVGNTCAVVANGEVYCWGTDNMRGKGHIVKSKSPVKVTGLKNVSKVVNGRNFFCALTSVGNVYCFGSNIFLQLGNKAVGRRYARPVRAKVPVATDIAANLFGACAVLASKKVYCWGDSVLGRKAAEPTQVASLDNAKSVVLGLNWACAVLYSGSVKCWGEGRKRAAGQR
jgi:alpha-tubulin suppressor-like RCC1 family protein